MDRAQDLGSFVQGFVSKEGHAQLGRDRLDYQGLTGSEPEVRCERRRRTPDIRGLTAGQHRRRRKGTFSGQESNFQRGPGPCWYVPTDFIDLRRYTPGDTIRSINWKASARNADGRNELLVNRYEPEGRKATWIFLDCAGYMEVGTSLTSPMEHAIEAVNTLAWFYLSRGYTLGAYAYNSPGGFLFPDEGMRQFDRLTEMLLSVRAGGESEDLLQAVERCKSFLLRLRPETFLVSRLDVHYPRQGESAESLDRFATGVRRLSAWKSRSSAVGATKVVDVSPQAYLPPEPPLEGQALSLMRWEAQPPSKALRGAGATVLHWNPLQEEFSKVLLRLSSVPR